MVKMILQVQTLTIEHFCNLPPANFQKVTKISAWQILSFPSRPNPRPWVILI